MNYFLLGILILILMGVTLKNKITEMEVNFYVCIMLCYQVTISFNGTTIVWK